MKRYVFHSTNMVHVPGLFSNLQIWNKTKNLNPRKALIAGFPGLPLEVYDKILLGDYNIKNDSVIVKV